MCIRKYKKKIELLKLKYVYFVSIKQNDKSEFFETRFAMTKKKYFHYIILQLINRIAYWLSS